MRSLILLITLFTLSLSVVAGDADSTTFFSVTKVDGQTIVATTYEQYVQLNDLVKTVNALKKHYSEGKITKDDYNAKVALLLGASFKKGATKAQPKE